MQNIANDCGLTAIPTWWHSIDLGELGVTPGQNSPAHLEKSFAALCLPDLKSQSIIDIGATDGYFSFEAERLGASRVVALDYFYWLAYEGGCRGTETQSRDVHTDFPGKQGFDFAHRCLNSKVEPVVADFMSVDLDRLGTFDISLFLGVLYHIQNPVLALNRLAAVTKKLAVIETHAIYVPGLEDRAICEFYDHDQLSNDPTNWCGPNLKALESMCKTAGFKRVEVIAGPPRRPFARSAGLPLSGSKKIVNYRAIVHAYK